MRWAGASGSCLRLYGLILLIGIGVDPSFSMQTICSTGSKSCILRLHVQSKRLATIYRALSAPLGVFWLSGVFESSSSFAAPAGQPLLYWPQSPGLAAQMEAKGCYLLQHCSSWPSLLAILHTIVHIGISETRKGYSTNQKSTFDRICAMLKGHGILYCSIQQACCRQLWPWTFQTE